MQFSECRKWKHLENAKRGVFIKCNFCWMWGQFVSVGEGSRYDPTSQTSQLSAFGSLLMLRIFTVMCYLSSVFTFLLNFWQCWQKSNIFKKKTTHCLGVNLAGLWSEYVSNRTTVCLKALCTSVLWKRQDLDAMLTDGGFCHSKWWILIICFFKPINFMIIIIARFHFSTDVAVPRRD